MEVGYLSMRLSTYRKGYSLARVHNFSVFRRQGGEHASKTTVEKRCATKLIRPSKIQHPYSKERDSRLFTVFLANLELLFLLRADHVLLRAEHS